MLPELKESDEVISQDVRTLDDYALEAIKNEEYINHLLSLRKKNAPIQTKVEIGVEVRYLGHRGSMLFVICRLRGGSSQSNRHKLWRRDFATYLLVVEYVNSNYYWWGRVTMWPKSDLLPPKKSKPHLGDTR